MKNEKLIKRILIGISIILIIVIIIICLGGDRFRLKSQSEIDKAKEEENLNKITEHTSYDGNFSISTSGHWVEVEKNSLNAKAIIELNNEEEYAYVVVVMTNKKDFDGDFAKYKERVFKQKEQYYGTKIFSYSKTEIDGYNAEYGEVYYTDVVNSTKSYIRAYAVETENYFGQIVIWTFASNEEKVQDEFDSIVSSFKEIKKVDELNEETDPKKETE